MGGRLVYMKRAQLEAAGEAAGMKRFCGRRTEIAAACLNHQNFKAYMEMMDKEKIPKEVLQMFSEKETGRRSERNRPMVSFQKRIENTALGECDT